MITLLFMAGVVAFGAFITLLMLDPLESAREDVVVATATPEKPQELAEPVLDPARVAANTRQEPVFFEQIGPRPKPAPTSSRPYRSPYVVDLSDR
jgi:hypothetical protein